jgi:hypothetical protein
MPRKAAKGRSTPPQSSPPRARGRKGHQTDRLPQLALAFVIAIAVLLFVPILFENANPFLASAKAALEQQLGLGTYIAPLLLSGLAALLVFSLRQRGYSIHWSRIVGCLAFFVGLLGLLQWWGELQSPSGTIAAGGYVGHAILETVSMPFGYLGAAPVLLGLTVGGAVTGLGLPLQRVRLFGRAFLRFASGTSRFSRKRLWPFLRRSAAHASVDAKRIATALGKVGRTATRMAGQSWFQVSRLAQRQRPGMPSTASLGEATNGDDDDRNAGSPKERKEKASASAVRQAPVSSLGGRTLILPNPSTEGWQLPPLDLLDNSIEAEGNPVDDEERAKALERTIEKAFEDFGVPVKVVERRPGPTVTQFGVEPLFHEKRARDGTILRREKVKIREITARSNDLALALAARSIRIEAPVPGRPVVGIEVPNQSTSMVSLRSELEHKSFQRARAKFALPIVLGRDVSGEVVTADLARMPHLLIAGATGSGKSVCINSLIVTLVMNHTPDDLRFLMIDPKRVELTMFDSIPHLLRPVVVDVEKAVPALFQAVAEMDKRYKEFAALGVRNIEGYNRLAARAGERPRLPFLVLVIDELADLMMLAPDEVERTICRLAQLARATGIHLVVATQRPSVDVVTGLIKANFPTRISFMVTSQVDSRTILDTAGAEKLLGRGDMLFLPSDAPKPMRLQGTYVSDDETEALTNFWRAQRAAQYATEFVDLPNWAPGSGNGDGGDELYDRALDLVHDHDSVSISFLQRKLRIGWNRAARLMEMLEENGELGQGHRETDNGGEGHDRLQEELV